MHLTCVVYVSITFCSSNIWHTHLHGLVFILEFSAIYTTTGCWFCYLCHFYIVILLERGGELKRNLVELEKICFWVWKLLDWFPRKGEGDHPKMEHVLLQRYLNKSQRRMLPMLKVRIWCVVHASRDDIYMWTYHLSKFLSLLPSNMTLVT